MPLMGQTLTTAKLQLQAGMYQSQVFETKKGKKASSVAHTPYQRLGWN